MKLGKVYVTPDWEFVCPVCGQKYKASLPCPVPIMVAIGQAFEKLHAECNPSKDND